MRALFLRDLGLALRQGGGAGLGVGFFLIAVTLLAFGVGANPSLLAAVAPGRALGVRRARLPTVARSVVSG